MTEYVALLRGVNVNGINIKMAELKKVLSQAGLQDVRTLLASGNVVFGSEEKNRKKLKTLVEKALADGFGYEAWIVLLTAGELAAMVERCPYPDDDPDNHAYVVVGSDAEVLKSLFADWTREDADASTGVEALTHSKSALFWQCPKGQSVDSPFAKRSGKAKYKAVITTRNLRTMRKILAVTSAG
jgi:uncharacterized protein (DUF1697 family)